MASKLGLMVKREAVDNRLRDSTNKLKARGVDVGTFPDEGRDRDLKEFQRVEYTATLLEACVARLDELIPAAKASAPAAAAKSEAEPSVPALRRSRS